MFEGNRICESSRAIQHLLEKYKPTDEDSTGRYVDYRTLIQPRDAIAKFAQFPEQRTDVITKRPSPSYKRIPDNIRNEIARLRSKGVRFDDIAKRLRMPVGTCKSVMHQRKHNQGR